MLVSSPRYTTHNDVQYEMEADYDGGFHQELKRDVHNMKRASNSSSRPKDSLQDGLPLFERYTYFSPGELILNCASMHADRLSTLHGLISHGLAVAHPLCRPHSYLRARGIIQGFRQGDGTAESEETAISITSTRQSRLSAVVYTDSITLAAIRDQGILQSPPS